MTNPTDLRILIVDDSKALRSLLKSSLMGIDPGWTIAEAENGDVALAHYEEEPFDIVFLDINMPGKDGIEVLEIVKKTDPYSYVVMLTSKVTNDWVIKAKNLGANGYIAKPFTTEKLIRVLNDHQKYQEVKSTLGA